MFYAVTRKGVRIPAEGGGMLPAGMDCYCPGCQEKVFLKMGQIKAPHFAHYQKEGCSTFSEGETARHLAGKRVLFDWLKEQNLETEMEPWLPQLQQRPDLLVRFQDGRKIVIEYQCSPIPIDRLRERTEGYQREGYEVVWLLGVDYGIGGQLKDKHVEFLGWSPMHAYGFVCLDSERGELELYHHLYFDERDHVRYAKKKVELAKLSFSHFLLLVRGESPMPLPAPPRTFTSGMSTRERMTLLRRKDARHRQFLERVYLNRHTLDNLPASLFRKPTKTLLYATPAYSWKYDFYCWLDEVGVGNLIQEEDVYRYQLQTVQAGRLSVKANLDLEPSHYIKPLLEVLATLVAEEKAALVGQGCWCLLARLL